MNHDDALSQRLKNALASKGSEYHPRTRHVENGQPLYINRLIFENSPYLLQHAHNPVDWYSWEAEAFATARRENKPIFLSIGYATCHWCHVMEEESFENPKVAELLNQHFIAIKVDREIHPDIDQLYMTAVMMISGRGGWPMSSFLTPEGKPFFSGTYYPPSVFIRLLTQIHTTWSTQRSDLLNQAEQLATAVAESNHTDQGQHQLDQQTIESALQSILYNYDQQHGGFSPAPKFPNETTLLFLAQQCLREPNTVYQDALDHTLNKMARGGIFDQIGGGFHRYSVDEYWLVPHFEKMLYNQAYLSRVFTVAFKLTGNPFYARIMRLILDFVLTEMSDTRGLFYSALDADSEGAEGTFYLWNRDEIENLLGKDDSDRLCRLFGVTDLGNFEGQNILHLSEPLSDTAENSGLSFEQYCQDIDPLILKLRKNRSIRTAPLTDDKVITAWNAMMATAFIEAGDTLNEPGYIETAKTTLQQLWQHQRVNTPSLQRIHKNGKTSTKGKQEDYAHFVEALIAIYDITLELIYLQQAIQLCDEMLSRFSTENSQILTMGEEQFAFARITETYDGALPSGNAVAIRVLYRLSRRFENPVYQKRADAMVNELSSAIKRQPLAYAYLLTQVDEQIFGELGSRQYFFDGKVKTFAEIDNKMLCMHFTIDTDVSVNADTIELKTLTGTDIPLIKQISSQPILKPVAFQSSPLAAFENNFMLYAQLDGIFSQNTLLNFKLTIQCCHEHLCMPAESRNFLVSSS